MDVQELTAEYGSKTDEELLRLALLTDYLTKEAQFALSAELTRRGLDTAGRLRTAREDEEARQAKIQRDPGNQFFVPFWGFGRMRFGKAQTIKDGSSGLERFKTTVFIVLFWLPLIPTGTYLAERDPDLADGVRWLERLPLDWEQVLRIWVAAAGLLLAFLWVMKLMLRMFF